MTVCVVVVDIYRRDSSGTERNIGEIKRDVEIIALSCPPDYPPIISGINGDSAYSLHVCTGHQTCFNIKASDQDTSDTTTLVWNNPGNMSGATFSVTSKKTKLSTAEFCWSPTSKYARSYPYNFVATATDDVCPLPGRVSRAFSIYVDAPPTANYSATVQKCGLVKFQANVSNTSPSSIVSYVWTGDSAAGSEPLYINGKSGSYYYNQQKKYYYTLTVTGSNGCSNSYRDSITISKIPELRVSKDTGLCSSTQLNITAIPSNYVKPYTITWNTGDTGALIRPYITKDTILVHYIYTNVYGCVTDDSIRISITGLPDVYAGNDTELCTLDDMYLLSNAKVTPTGGTWFPLTGTPSNAIVYSKYRDSVFFDRNATGITDTVYGFVYTYSKTSTGVNASCSNSDTVFIGVAPLPTHPVLYAISPKCFNDPAIELYAGPPYVDASHQNGTWTYPRKPSAIVNNYGNVIECGRIKF